MSHPADDGYASAVIETVRDMQSKLEEHKRAGDEGRAALLSSVESTVAAMRQDVHKALASLQINQADHKLSHEADRVERATRQQQVDAQLAEIRKWVIGALIGIGLVGGILIGWLVFGRFT